MVSRLRVGYDLKTPLEQGDSVVGSLTSVRSGPVRGGLFFAGPVLPFWDHPIDVFRSSSSDEWLAINFPRCVPGELTRIYISLEF